MKKVNPMIVGMQNTILELRTWKNENIDIPESVTRAINRSIGEMKAAIEKLQKNPFEIGDDVELVTDIYEDDGHFCGDKGIVVDVKSTPFSNGYIAHDIRVEWDNGAEECWISAEGFV